MSSNNEEEKPEGNKAFPLDLASKLTVKPVEVTKGPPLVMTAQPLRQMRVLTHTTVATGNTTVTGPTISIVPQAPIKGETLQRGQLANIISPQASQTATGLTVARPAQITLTTSVMGQTATTGGTTYHVPRGPAVVANLATPRSALATPIRTPGIATTPPGQTSGFASAVRQAPPRTPSPAATALPATAWLSTPAAMQVGTIKTTTANTVQRVPVSGTPVVTRTQQIVARATPVNAGPRAAIVHTGIAIGQSTAVHSFKSGGGIQSLNSAVTLAQVLPARTQTLVYSANNNPHFTTGPRLAVTGTTISSQRQSATTARPGQVMTTRLAVPVTGSQQSTRLTVTPGQGTIFSGTRISAASQNTVIGAPTRIAAVTSNQPVTLGRLSGNSSATLITTSQARLAVTNTAHGPNPQAGSAVVLGTQSGRIAASVVSLHPVVVAANSNQTRTIQTQGPKVSDTLSKVINQQGQLTQVPTIAKIPQQPAAVVPVTVAVAATPTTRTISVTPAAIVSQRPIVAVSSAQTIPIAKVFPQSTRSNLETSDSSAQQVQSASGANVYLHTGVVRRSSPGPTGTSQPSDQQRNTLTTAPVTTYSAYYYDTNSGYAVSGNNIVARPFTPSSGSFTPTGSQQQASAQIRSAAVATQVHGIMSGQSIQFNPVMVVEQKRGNQPFVESGIVQQSQTSQEHINTLPSIGKVTSSPRPSILRKRDNEGSPLKAAKNLTPVLANLSAPTSPPSRPDSRDNGNQSSGGSTTISATSSPGGMEPGDDSQPLPAVSNASAAVAQAAIKLEQEVPQEMSPRKKPRKQQLTGNDLHEPKFNIEDMQFLSESKIKKENDSDGTPTHQEVPAKENRNSSEIRLKKPAPASLLNSYKQTWKSTHNHYMRYTDVKPKDERRPTIIDLANQNRVLQKINGWKIYHLSTQMEDLADLETQVYDRLGSLLRRMETKDPDDKDINKINELIKGNMQRSKIINDGLLDAKNQVMKIFDHKDHVADIINRCASKRNFKKRDKF